MPIVTSIAMMMASPAVGEVIVECGDLRVCEDVRATAGNALQLLRLCILMLQTRDVVREKRSVWRGTDLEVGETGPFSYETR